MKKRKLDIRPLNLVMFVVQKGRYLLPRHGRLFALRNPETTFGGSWSSQEFGFWQEMSVCHYGRLGAGMTQYRLCFCNFTPLFLSLKIIFQNLLSSREG